MKFLYQFSAGDSLLHRLDPRTKMVLIICLLVSTFVVPQPWLMPLFVIALLWALGRIGPNQYWPFLLFMVPLVAGILMIHLLSGGPPYYPVRLLGVIPVSIPGWASGSAVAFRLVAMGISFIMFSMTTDPFDWGLAMYRAGLPYRIAFMFAFALRFFPLLQEELAVIRNALAARGSAALATSNPFSFLAGVAASVMPLGLGALRRSQDIALAMELRGFGYAEEAGVRRTLFRDIRLRPVDYAFGTASLLMLAGAVAWAAEAGSLPVLTRGQKTFAAVLGTLLAIVSVLIAVAVLGRREGTPARPPGQAG